MPPADALPPERLRDPLAASPMDDPTGELALAHARAQDLLLRRSQLMVPGELQPLVLAAARELGATDATLYIIDYGQRELLALDARFEPLSVETSLAGRAFRLMEPQEARALHGRRLWVPLIDGVDRLGVLLVELPDDGFVAAGLRGAFGQLAHLLAELLLTTGRYTDTYEWVRRRQPMSLPAELQHSLLPPLTFGTGTVVISGLVEPAYDVGGDAFDYALNGTIAHVAVFDAMGHGLRASQLASLAVGTYRNCRRAGLGLADTVGALDETLAEIYDGDRFVTAVLAQLDVDSGLYRWISAGHPPGLLLRAGQDPVELDGPARVPLGLGRLRRVPAAGQPAEQVRQLEPGDRVLLLTDGVDEARSFDGQLLGRVRLAELAAREAATGLPTPEVLRRLVQAVLRHQSGTLTDDALTLLVEWRGQARPSTG